MKRYDVVALGELLVDFTGSGASEQGNPVFEANPGGAPCNVLAMLRKLDRRSAFSWWPNMSLPTLPTKAQHLSSFRSIASTLQGAPPGLASHRGLPCSEIPASVKSIKSSPRATTSYCFMGVPPFFILISIKMLEKAFYSAEGALEFA